VTNEPFRLGLRDVTSLVRTPAALNLSRFSVFVTMDSPKAAAGLLRGLKAAAVIETMTLWVSAPGETYESENDLEKHVTTILEVSGFSCAYLSNQRSMVFIGYEIIHGAN
jgi:hypothetical protein